MNQRAGSKTSGAKARRWKTWCLIAAFLGASFTSLALLASRESDERTIALLVPLSGENTRKGHEHLRATRLALQEQAAKSKNVSWTIKAFDTAAMKDDRLLRPVLEELGSDVIAVIGFHTSDELKQGIRVVESIAKQSSEVALPPFIITPTATTSVKSFKSNTRFLRACPDNAKIAHVLLERAKEAKCEITVLYDANAYGEDLRDAIAKKASDINEAGETTVQVISRAIDAEIKVPREFSGPVIVACSHVSTRRVIEAWIAAGFNQRAHILFSDGAFFAEVVSVLDDFENALVVSLVSDTTELGEYMEAYEDVYEGQRPDGYGFWTWYCVNHIVANSSDGENVLKNLISKEKLSNGRGIQSIGDDPMPCLITIREAQDLLFGIEGYVN